MEPNFSHNVRLFPSPDESGKDLVRPDLGHQDSGGTEGEGRVS